MLLNDTHFLFADTDRHFCAAETSLTTSIWGSQECRFKFPVPFAFWNRFWPQGYQPLHTCKKGVLDHVPSAWLFVICLPDRERSHQIVHWKGSVLHRPLSNAIIISEHLVKSAMKQLEKFLPLLPKKLARWRCPVPQLTSADLQCFMDDV